jgi:periplasmic copper chaperone A
MRTVFPIVFALASWGCGAGGAGDPAVEGAWIRMVPAGQGMTAAYMFIENPAGSDLVLRAAETPAAGVVEIHEMVHEADVMKMRKIEALKVPARGAVELQPGGLHLMLIDLVEPLEEGEELPLLLHFEGPEQRKIVVRVRAIVQSAVGQLSH